MPFDELWEDWVCGLASNQQVVERGYDIEHRSRLELAGESFGFDAHVVGCGACVDDRVVP